MLYLQKSTNQFIRGKNTLKHHEDMRLPYVNLRVDKPDLQVIKDSSSCNVSVNKQGSTVYVQNISDSDDAKVTIKIQGYDRCYITAQGSFDKICITYPDHRTEYISIMTNPNEEMISLHSYTSFIHLLIEKQQQIIINVSDANELNNKKSLFFDKKVITEEEIEQDQNKYALISLLKDNENVQTPFLTKKQVELKTPVLCDADLEASNLFQDGNTYTLDLNIFKNIEYSPVPLCCNSNFYVTINNKTNYYFPNMIHSESTLDSANTYPHKSYKSRYHRKIIPLNITNVNSYAKKYYPYVSIGNEYRGRGTSRLKQLCGHVDRIGKFAFYNSSLKTVDIVLTNVDDRLKNKLGCSAFSMCGVTKVRIFTRGSLVIPARCFRGCPVLEEVEIFINHPDGINHYRNKPKTVVQFCDKSFSGCTKLKSISVIGLRGTDILEIRQKAFNYTPLQTLYTDGVIRFVNFWDRTNDHHFPDTIDDGDRYISNQNCRVNVTRNPQLTCYTSRFDNIGPIPDNYCTIMNSIMASEKSICRFITI